MLTVMWHRYFSGCVYLWFYRPHVFVYPYISLDLENWIGFLCLYFISQLFFYPCSSLHFNSWSFIFLLLPEYNISLTQAKIISRIISSTCSSILAKISTGFYLMNWAFISYISGLFAESQYPWWISHLCHSLSNLCLQWISYFIQLFLWILFEVIDHF
jgi:hypothetical protein